MPLTAHEIDEYIRCSKTITSRPRREPEQIDGSYRNRFELYSEECKTSFSVFSRQLIKFPENYSIGLVMRHLELGDITLFRCNGIHGPTSRGLFDIEHHREIHCHIITPEQIDSGFLTNPAFHSTLTTYDDFSSALLYFCRQCGIIGYEAYFDTVEQMRLEIGD